MKDKQKKEIEDKWQRLLDRNNKSPTERSSVLPTDARVIRRRKGRKDLPITLGSAKITWQGNLRDAR